MLGNGITIELKVQTLDVQSRIDAGASGVKLVRSARGEEKKARALAPATQGACGASHCGGGAFKQEFPAKQPTSSSSSSTSQTTCMATGSTSCTPFSYMVDIYCLDMYIFKNSRSYIIKLNLELPEYVIPTAATAA